MLIVDGHLDLAMNALAGNRDLSVSAYTTRTHEFGSAGKGKAQGTVALPEMRQGRVALSFVTMPSQDRIFFQQQTCAIAASRLSIVGRIPH